MSQPPPTTKPPDKSNRKLLSSLAVIQAALSQAMSQRKSIAMLAGTMHDDWGKKVADPHDPDLHHHLLERRSAALLAGGNHED